MSDTEDRMHYQIEPDGHINQYDPTDRTGPFEGQIDGACEKLLARIVEAVPHVSWSADDGVTFSVAATGPAHVYEYFDEPPYAATHVVDRLVVQPFLDQWEAA